MKILAISASGRRTGNINQICSKIIEGAASNGHETEIINLYDYSIKHCIGCLECTKTRKCVLKDDFNELYKKEEDADLIIMATPVYCHSVPGALKDFIDRNCHAVIPYMDIDKGTSYFGKLKFVNEYLKKFKANVPFKNKRFITVIACSNPSKNGDDIKSVSSLMKKFVEGEMGGKIFKCIKCTDTLFQLNPRNLDKVHEQALNLGSSIK